jgi:flagellar biosynthesis component FlhA
VSNPLPHQPAAPLSGGKLAPDKLTLGVLHRVLQRLLNVDVPTRDLVLILEAIAESAEKHDGLDRSTPREAA